MAISRPDRLPFLLDLLGGREPHIASRIEGRDGILGSPRSRLARLDGARIPAGGSSSSAGLGATSSCALASFAIDGIDSVALSRHLLERYKILAPRHHSRPDLPPPIWVNTSPFTTIAELDTLVTALRSISRHGSRT